MSLRLASMMRGYEILGIYSHFFKLRRSRRSPTEVIEAVQGAKEVQGSVGESPQVDRGISGIGMASRQRTFVQIASTKSYLGSHTQYSQYLNCSSFSSALQSFGTFGPGCRQLVAYFGETC